MITKVLNREQLDRHQRHRRDERRPDRRRREWQQHEEGVRRGFDGGGIGDSLLTQTTDYPGGSAVNRVSQMFYDWRDRSVASKSGVQASESTSVHRPISYTEYDNLSEVIAQESYDGDGISVVDANTDGVPDKPSATLRRSRSTTTYDEQGRGYRSQTFSVDQATGTISTNALTSNSWYDLRGVTIKTSTPGGLVSMSLVDGAGRTTKTYTTDGGGDTTWADVSNVTGDVVLEQVEATYDSANNVILKTSRQRFHRRDGDG